MRLSHSQISKYGQCARSYKLYYIDKLRERTATAFLAFGSAMDNALNNVLYDYKANKSVTIDYKAAFDEAWVTVEINKKKHQLLDCTLIGYAKADFVEELLTEEDVRFIKVKIEELEPAYIGRDLTELKLLLDEGKASRNYRPFSDEEHKILNILNYHSMRRKGHLMLDAFVRDIIPQITDVQYVQHKIELGSNTSDSLIGYVDAVVKLKGSDEWVVLDNKTASAPYDPDKVKTSEQLSLYTYTLGLKRAAYAVMSKIIKLNKEKTCAVCSFEAESGSRHKSCSNEIDGKRCGGVWNEVTKPSASTQLLVGDIDEMTQNVVIDNIGEVSSAIEHGIFPKNLSACGNIFGNPCPYIKTCWKGESSHLEKME